MARVYIVSIELEVKGCRRTKGARDSLETISGCHTTYLLLCHGPMTIERGGRRGEVKGEVVRFCYFPGAQRHYQQRRDNNDVGFSEGNNDAHCVSS